MIELSSYLTFVLATVAIVIVPGPTVTVIIANSLRHGTGAGLGNVIGTQAGIAMMIVILAAGLELVIQAVGQLFVVIKIIGAAYLVYLGVRMLLNRSPLPSPDDVSDTANMSSMWSNRFLMQGLLVIWSNPKALLFFGAFIPQFIDPAGSVVLQTLLLGATFMVVATVLDSAYAVLAGQARHWLTQTRVRTLEIASGLILVGGGIWLAFTRRTVLTCALASTPLPIFICASGANPGIQSNACIEMIPGHLSNRGLVRVDGSPLHNNRHRHFLTAIDNLPSIDTLLPSTRSRFSRWLSPNAFRLTLATA